MWARDLVLVENTTEVVLVQNTTAEVLVVNTAGVETMSSCPVESNQLEITLDKTLDIFITSYVSREHAKLL